MFNWLRRHRPAPERPIVEAVEALILHSADLGAALGIEAASLDAPEIRTLDDAGEFASPAAAATARATASTGAVASLPLAFERNVGQAGDAIDFLARGSGYAVGLAHGDAIIVLGQGDSADAVTLTLDGARPAPAAEGGDLLASRTHYLTGDASQWHADVANYGQVTYRGVYDGVDLTYYGNARALEYDFRVAAGADAGAIAFSFAGAGEARVAADGSLDLTLASGATLRFLAPVAYQEGAAGRELVASRYLIDTDGTVRFALGDYDHARALVIDPVLAYGSYLGGTGAESGTAVTTDAAGNVYVTGHSASGGLLGNLLGLRGGEDIMVTKLSADLTGAVYTTYLGGTGNERGTAIAVDAGGNAYITGWTTSGSGLGGFPTTGGFDSTLSGSQDAFVMKLAANGASLVYSSYLGGSGNADRGNGIAVDGAGAAWVVGTTTSANFPVGGDAADTTLAGEEAFIAKISASGSSLSKATFFGGSGNDRGLAIALSSGQVLIAGTTNSADLSVSGGSFQSGLAGGYDAFVARFNPASNNITGFTYLGGNADDSANAIAVRGNGSVVVGGSTLSGNLATTSGAYQAAASSGGDGFVAVLGGNLKSLDYLTYLGGNGGGSAESVGGVAVDASGRVYAVGSTGSSNFPLTADAANNSQSGASDGFIALIDPAIGGSAGLLYSTLVGGSGTDTLAGAAYGTGRLYAVGNTASGSGIAAGGGAQPTYGGATDAFVVRLDSNGNSAPLLAGANALTGVTEDAATNPGTLVSALIAGRVTDADSGALRGIAVTAVDATHGTWQYTTDGGASWQGLAGVSASAARLLAADTLTSVRFVPAADWNGSVAAGLTFRAWDQSGGTAGATASTGSNGGATAFSAATATASINVQAVNDAPAGTSNTITTPEDTPYVFTGADFGFSDPHDAPANALAAVRIVSIGGVGALTDNGVAVTAGQSVSAADIAAGRLVFTPASNANGTAYAGFTFQVRDDGGTVNGGVDLDPVARTMTVDVTAVNDAPTLNLPGAQSTASNTPVIFSTGAGNGIVIADVDAGAGTLSLTLAVANGTLSLGSIAGLGFITGSGTGDTTMRFSGSLAAINAALDGLRFDPAGGYSGSTTITLSLDDQGNSGGGGSGTVSEDLVINVAHVNSAPVLSGAGTMNIIIEDATGNAGTAVSALIAGHVTDADAAALSGIAVTGVDNSHGTWQYSSDGGANWTAFGSVQSTSARLLEADATTFVRFVPAADWNGAVIGGLAFRAWDLTAGVDGGTADTTINGGTSAFSAAITNTGIVVTGVNDAPAGASRTVTALEDAAYVFSAADFGFGDARDTPANALAAVRIATLPAVGGLTDNGATVVAGQFISAADIGAGLLRFTPGANASGTGYAAFAFQVRDDGGTANGGVDLDPIARTMSVDVTPVNDAPAGADRTVTTLEDTAYVFSVADFGFSDTTDTPANALSAVRLATLPASGALTLNGSAVAAGQFVSATDVAAGRLLFTPAANATAIASFTFQVRDDGGTAGGGVDLDPVARTLSIAITAVNDAPTGADHAVTTLEDTPYVFGAADFGFQDAADAPANAFTAVRIATLGTGGSLTLDGAIVGAGGMVGVSDIIAGKLVFTPGANAAGASNAFSFQVQDDGGSANGGSDLDPVARVMRVDVTPVNDAPSGANGVAVLDAASGHVFTLADFSFTDSVDTPANALAAVRMDTLPASGNLTLGAAPVAAGQWVTAADIAAGRLRIAAATPGAQLGFSVRDDGGTAHGGLDTETATHTLTLARAIVAAADATPSDAAAGGAISTQALATPAAATAGTVTTTTPPAATGAATAGAAGTTAATPTVAATANAVIADGTDPLSRSPAPREASATGGGATGPAAAGYFAGAVSFTGATSSVSAERRADAAEALAAAEPLLLALPSGAVATTPAATLAEQAGSAMRSIEFTQALDAARHAVDAQPDLRDSAAFSAGGATLGVSFAYALWMLRGGVLMGSMLSAMPAWRVLDPLPVLPNRASGDAPDDDDDPADAGGDAAPDAAHTLKDD